jgi:hypothetical protein
MKRFFLFALGAALAASPLFALDDDEDNNGKPQAVPFVFIGKAGDCGPAAGSRIVTSAWLAGLGLPDDGTSANGSAGSANDPHFGLLLSKNGLTTDCSAAGATITGVGSLTVPATPAVLELGFDIRNGTHCGAGAPRFNIVTSDNVTHFAGCADGTLTPAPQNPLEWTRVRFTTAAQIFSPLTPGMKIKSISIIYDEGTDTAGVTDPNGVGLAVIDNIDVAGKLITSGPGNNGNGNDHGDGNDKN